MYSKFFDYQAPLFHHLHLDDDAAGRVGRIGKPEAYYFPPQLNNHLGDFPVTYFGFDPDVTKEKVRERLLRYEDGDNRITELSRAYRIELGTGWYTPPGVVHAPGSVLTYEPQWNSDVNSVYENVTAGEVYPDEFLVENCLPTGSATSTTCMSLMDWEKNVDPHYKQHYFRPPIVAHADERSRREVDHLRQPLRRRQGADGPAGADRDGQGRGGLRLHPRPGARHVRRLRRGGGDHAALRPAQRRRVLRERRSGEGRRDSEQPQPVGAAGDAQALRAEPS